MPMASAGMKKCWRLQDFMAHDANVNCLALGHKSGRVLVTGGDDKMVNLWAVGKHSCFMSLGGHQTPIECVQFNPLEELVCAGSRAGALKVWDLEAAKLVRTLNGHKGAVRGTDFHPYGELLTSASADSSVKLWDSRKKGCICTYNGHKGSVNCVRFSPDAQWVASGGDDGTVRIWDLRVGRSIKEFQDHINAVNCVEFHPREFLLASGGADKTVNFNDLESFQVVSSERDLGAAVRSMCFNTDGECLFVGCRDWLRVLGWEPSRVFDSVPVNWGRIADISIAQCQLVGASFHLTNVQIFVVDLKKVHPLTPTSLPAQPLVPSSNETFTKLSTSPNISGSAPILSSTPTLSSAPVNLNSSTNGSLGQNVNQKNTSTGCSPFTPNQSIRKSFTKAERPINVKNSRSPSGVKTIDESTSGTDPEEEPSNAEVINLTDYNEIFHGKGLSRTPPPLEPEPFQEPEHDYSDEPPKPHMFVTAVNRSSNFEALSLDHHSTVNFQRGSDFTSPPSPLHIPFTASTVLSAVSPFKGVHSTSTTRSSGIPSSIGTITNTTHLLSPKPSYISPSRSKSNLDQVYHYHHGTNNHNGITSNSRLISKEHPATGNSSKNNMPPPQRLTKLHILQRQSSCKDVGEVPSVVKQSSLLHPNHAHHLNAINNANNIRHSQSEANITNTNSNNNNNSRGNFGVGTNRSRKNSLSKSSNNKNGSSITEDRTPRKPLNFLTLGSTEPTNHLLTNGTISNHNNTRTGEGKMQGMHSLSSSNEDGSPVEEEEFVPHATDRPVGLDVDDFLPKNHRSLGVQQVPDMSEAEVLGALMRGHEPMLSMLRRRQRSLQVVLAQYRSKDMKAAVETAVAMDDLALLVDLLGVLNFKHSLWNLDVCVLILPRIKELLQSKFEIYMMTGCNTVRQVLKHFGQVIKSNVQSPAGSFGVDITREERYRKALKCHDILMGMKSALVKKQTMPGSVGQHFTEVYDLVQSTFD